MTTPSDPSYREIPLTQGMRALVDAADYPEVARFSWCAAWRPDIRSYYAYRNEKQPDGKIRIIGMHRQILGLAPGDHRRADHALHNTLDNRRIVDGKVNLREASKSENARNRLRNQRHSVGLKGVQKCGQRYRARISDGTKILHLGVRDTAEEAHRLYVDAALRIHGEFACDGEPK